MRNRIALTSAFAACFLLCAIITWAQGGAGQTYQGTAIEEMLLKGKVSGMKELPEGVTLPKKATLEYNGEKHYGVWKTIDEGPVPSKELDRGVEVQFQDSWRTEIAAYELDKLLDFGMVPATVERVIDGKHGSMQFFVDSVMTEGDRVKKKVNPPNPVYWNQQVARIRLWDNLIYNTDRNLGNLLVTSDWKIRVIDHSRTFRPFEQLQDPKQLTIFSRTMLAKIEALNEPTLKEHLGKYLTPTQIEGLMKRRAAILALSKKLIEEKGAGAVLFQ